MEQHCFSLLIDGHAETSPAVGIVKIAQRTFSLESLTGYCERALIFIPRQIRCEILTAR